MPPRKDQTPTNDHLTNIEIYCRNKEMGSTILAEPQTSSSYFNIPTKTSAYEERRKSCNYMNKKLKQFTQVSLATKRQSIHSKNTTPHSSITPHKREKRDTTPVFQNTCQILNYDYPADGELLCDKRAKSVLKKREELQK